MTIGKKIYELRKNKGLTQEKLAKEFSLTAQTISKWESDISLPDVTLLPQIAAFFGISIDALFEFSREKEYERIENMTENQRFLTNEEFMKAERFLIGEIERDPKEYKAISQLGDLYHFQATRLDLKASEYAKRALEMKPNSKFDHSTLVNAAGGVNCDWNISNHNNLIDYYYEFVRKNPNYPSGYLYLFDLLVADARYEEALEIIRQRRKVKEDGLNDYEEYFVVEKKEGFAAAKPLYEKLAKEKETEWRVLISIANSFAFNGAYEEALKLFEKSFALEEKPRYIDSLESIAQLYLKIGKRSEAVEAYKREIALLAEEWNTSFGESVDRIKREIEKIIL